MYNHEKVIVEWVKERGKATAEEIANFAKSFSYESLFNLIRDGELYPSGRNSNQVVLWKVAD